MVKFSRTSLFYFIFEFLINFSYFFKLFEFFELLKASVFFLVL